MVGQKTAALIVLLNIFSLKTANADAFYDALKATGKTDPTTTATVRGSTVDSSRRAKMNALTQNNPDYIAPSQLKTKTYTDADLKKMKDDDSRQPETDDDRADKLTEAKLKKDAGKDVLPPVPLATKSNEPGLPLAPTKGQDGSTLKVTNTDPDFVSFQADETTTVKSPKKP